jgi:hypothetical protein
MRVQKEVGHTPESLPFHSPDAWVTPQNSVPAALQSVETKNVSNDSGAGRINRVRLSRTGLQYVRLTVRVTQQTHCWYFPLWTHDGSNSLIVFKLKSSR